MRSNVNIAVNRDTCTVCGICVETCIMDNLRMHLSPCRNTCPLHVNAQGYIRMIAIGKEEEAARLLRKDLPFAGIIGRICSRPCEDVCERAKIDGQAVHILALKRYIADKMPEIINEPATMCSPSGKRVAIIGAGPAGMMAAHDIAVKGHSVTIFDAASEPGGMLRWGIPEFRLSREVVDQSIQMLEKMKIEFKTGFMLGKELDIDRLEREWDSVLLATGMGSAVQLNIPGEDIENVYNGIDFLREVRHGKKPPMGKSVIVIGGGNTAVDAALTCRKLGAQKVSIICLEDNKEMPAFGWEIAEAVEEGVEVQNCLGVKKIYRDNGRLGAELSRCLRVFDDEGRFAPTLEKECCLSPSADTIVIAIGQKSDLSGVPDNLVNENKTSVLADSVTFQTNRRKIFSAGDVIGGKQSVVHAMAQGREAALSIDRFLEGEKLGWGRKYWDGIGINNFHIDASKASTHKRCQLPRIPIGQRTLVDEVEKTIDTKDARLQAERCLNCGYPAEVNQTCWSCLPCEIECPVDALEVRIPYLIR